MRQNIEANWDCIFSWAMNNTYLDLIQQSFEFPQNGFRVENDELHFHDIPLMDVIKQYGTPLKITYLPKIGEQITKARRLFHVAMAKVDYQGEYVYCYCTKSSHFSFVVEEALRHDIHPETSSAYDFAIIKKLYEQQRLNKGTHIVCRLQNTGLPQKHGRFCKRRL